MKKNRHQGSSMPFPSKLRNLGGVSLTTVEGWSKNDLESCTCADLKAILAHINKGVYDMACPERYLGRPLKKGGKKDDLLRRILSPQRDDFDDGRYLKVQGNVVQELLGNYNTKRGRAHLEKQGWVKKYPGHSPESWVFKKNVIEKHLGVNGETKGNPFTVFKIDDREGASREMWCDDLRVEYVKHAGGLYLRLRQGFDEAFQAFPQPGTTHTYDGTTSAAQSLARMQMQGESSAEAHNFFMLMQLFEDEIRTLLGVPQSARLFTKGAHRMKHADIGQVEIDATLAWEEASAQYRAFFELKGRRDESKGWDHGFSIHQLVRPYMVLQHATEHHALDCRLLPVYCRFEQGRTDKVWNAHVDVYAYDEATGVLTHQRGASFTDIPKPPKTPKP
jgi:hypothetical protein